jgi:hypothetical protein
MKKNQSATHNHKTAGLVVLLKSTTVLGEVLNPVTDNKFWVKLADLTQLVGGANDDSKLGKKQLGKDRPHASVNSRHRVVRAA